MQRLRTLIGISMLASMIVRADDPPKPDPDAGKKIYTGKCAKCHKLRDPNKYDEKKWDEWMVKMKKKAKLTDEQYTQVCQYAKTLRTDKK